MSCATRAKPPRVPDPAALLRRPSPRTPAPHRPALLPRQGTPRPSLHKGIFCVPSGWDPQSVGLEGRARFGRRDAGPDTPFATLLGPSGASGPGSQARGDSPRLPCLSWKNSCRLSLIFAPHDPETFPALSNHPRLVSPHTTALLLFLFLRTILSVPKTSVSLLGPVTPNRPRTLCLVLFVPVWPRRTDRGRVGHVFD